METKNFETKKIGVSSAVNLPPASAVLSEDSCNGRLKPLLSLKKFLFARNEKNYYATKNRLSVLCIVLSLFLFTPSAYSFNPSRLADAIYRAENSTKYPYGIKSIECNKPGKISCRQACLNTINNQLKRHKSHSCGLSYLECLRNRYAPLSDSKLNSNWLKNVRYFYENLSV